MSLSSCYSMPTNSGLITLSTFPITAISSTIIFTASTATFIEDFSAYHTMDIDLGSLTSVSAWCTQ